MASGITMDSNHSAWKTFITAMWHQPSVFDDLPRGIRFAHEMVVDPWLAPNIKDLLHQWAATATELLDAINGTTQYPVAIKYPEHCKVCNHHNPYAGAEHMTPCGLYVCRQCRPAWDRKERMAVMKEEEALREAKKAICG